MNTNATMKNLIDVKSSWDETKEKLKREFASLDGKQDQDELLERLQLKLGKSREEIQRIIYVL